MHIKKAKGGCDYNLHRGASNKQLFAGLRQVCFTAVISVGVYIKDHIYIKMNIWKI